MSILMMYLLGKIILIAYICPPLMQSSAFVMARMDLLNCLSNAEAVLTAEPGA